MNAQNLALAKGLVDAPYIEQGSVELRKREGLVRVLLSQRALPEAPWDDATIRMLLGQLAAMDSNNFVGTVGAGEREARVHSALVRERHYGFGHGIGRSGDIAAVQPKAAGSSLIYALTNILALHAVRLCGVTGATSALVLPLATGMSLALTLQAVRAARPSTARFVVWSRIDQKSALKCISAAGLTAVVVPPLLVGDALQTDVGGMERAVAACGGPDCVAAFLTTTSCFAPRSPDDVVAVACLALALGVGHVINHAYGLQSSKLCHVVNEAARVGRLDAFVSSTDKNFLVPVGGALVAGPSASVIDAVSASYPGRASASPILDLFITLLGMGQSGLKGLLAQRKAVFAALKERLTTVAAEAGEHLLSSPANPISLALSLNTLVALGGGRATYLGSMLFSRGVSGTRVISPSDEPSRRIDGHTFAGYGTSLDDYPHTYLTAAAAMGMTLADVEAYASRLERTLREYRKQRTPSPSGSLLMAGGADGQPELAAAEMGEGNEQASGR